MHVSISAKQVKISDRLRDDVAQRLELGINKYFDRAIDAQVQFSREGSQVRSDISVHAGSGIQLQAHGVSEDLATAFDIAADRVEKRLRRYKRRLVDQHHGRKGAPDTTMAARQVVLAGEDAAARETESAADAPVTIAETTTTIHTLTVGEAVMRLELADLPVLVFRNGGHGGLNVVYRRADGNIGWIDPSETERAD